MSDHALDVAVLESWLAESDLSRLKEMSCSSLPEGGVGRAAVVANRETPAELLTALSVDSEVRVRQVVLKNRAASGEDRAQAAVLGTSRGQS